MLTAQSVLRSISGLPQPLPSGMSANAEGLSVLTKQHFLLVHSSQILVAMQQVGNDATKPEPHLGQQAYFLEELLSCWSSKMPIVGIGFAFFGGGGVSSLSMDATDEPE